MLRSCAVASAAGDRVWWAEWQQILVSVVYLETFEQLSIGIGGRGISLFCFHWLVIHDQPVELNLRNGLFSSANLVPPV